MTTRRALGLRYVVLVNIAAIFSLRTVTDVARLGWAALPLTLLAFAVFFVPLTLAVVSLSSRYPESGGLYRWTQTAFGPAHGFVCGWSYFVNNLAFFPAVLTHVAALLPWLLLGQRAGFAQSPSYVLAVGLIGLWGLAVLPNALGARRTAQVSGLGVAGLLLGTLVLAVLASVAALRGESAAGGPPPFSGGNAIATFAMLSSLPFMFAGLELAPTMGGEVRDASKTLVKAALLAGALVTVLFVVAITAVVLGLRPDQIELTDGIPAAVAALRAPGLVTRVIAACLIVAAIGSVVVWMAGTAHMVRAAGVDRAMPAWFTREHPRFGTPMGGLIAQGVAASLLLAASVAGSSVREAYAILRSVTQLLYFVPFLYLFASHWKLAGAARARVGSVLGFVTTLAGLVAAALPPSDVESVALFELKVLGGSVLLIAAGLPLYLKAAALPRRRASFRG
jgi:glutamate:GABA antiporter